MPTHDLPLAAFLQVRSEKQRALLSIRCTGANIIVEYHNIRLAFYRVK
ncbi:hypothetical protein H206_01576 [Candidatus Electrothrix aarhusensis]|uniref:Uncharacterized protein n=1 Tax=Candidatus Electrothrix aarhusensis TaxID=1859131 RepID=A0A444IRE3_9BACT|nr:hypothetical protein H206_01576 [Candidatus Electrothrix aarhusensis]